MPSGKRLLEDFLLPALNTRSFGHFLEWVDSEEKNCFKVLYHHKNGHNWSTGSANVFVAWDKLKGRTQDTDDYFTKSRQRFRVALAKCPRLEKMPKKGDKHVEIFKILSQKKKLSKRDLLSTPQVQDLPKEEKHPAVTTIEVPVFCSVITPQNRSQNSVIVSPEDIRLQRRLSMEGLSNFKLKEEPNAVTGSTLKEQGTSLELKIKTEVTEERNIINNIKTEKMDNEVAVSEPTKESSKIVKTENHRMPMNIPVKIVHRMPVVPIPERTSGIELLKSKPKTLPQVIRYVPFLQPTNDTKQVIYHNTRINLSTGQEHIVNSESNLSLINIQNVQKLKK